MDTIAVEFGTAMKEPLQNEQACMRVSGIRLAFADLLTAIPDWQQSPFFSRTAMKCYV